MAARAYSGKKPKNLKHTLRVFLSYLGRHKKMLAVVAVLVTISAGANLFGTYMIRPVVNGLADGDVHTLLRGVLITALIFGCGALAAYGYTQTKQHSRLYLISAAICSNTSRHCRCSSSTADATAIS